MKVLSSLSEVPLKPLFFTLGIFDSFHLGHQKIFKRLNYFKEKYKCKSCVITFYPHPEKILKKSFLGYVLPLKKRLNFFKKQNVDYCVIMNFNKRLAKICAEDFLKRLIKKSCIKGIIVGEEFKLGRDQRYLREFKNFFERRGIIAEFVKVYKKKKKKISTKFIKALIRKADFKNLKLLLGREYSICSKVIKGKGRGKILGFPTANLDTKDLVLPKEGVYISKTLVNKNIYFSLLSVGRRPTFEKKGKLCCEVYILNFKGNLYGKELEVFPLKFLRRQEKFKNLYLLKKRINEDVKILEKFMKNYYIKKL